MSAPFQPGDVVVCIYVDVSTCPDAEWLPSEGHHYRVTECFLGFEHGGDPAWAVTLAEDPIPADPEEGDCWHASWFRKLEAADESFREQMRSLGKPKTAPMIDPARHSRELVK